MTTVTTYYLEMTSARTLNAKPEAEGLSVVEAEVKQYEFNRFLYQFIGKPWGWTDKLTATDQQWKDYAENENLRTWIAYYKGAIAGYYELQQQKKGNTEIVYFGLAPGFIGMGFGGPLLSAAIKSAWEWQGTRRVWVHTCTLDHPSALNNYLARGFEIYHRETANA